MAQTSLETFVAAVRREWGPITSELVAACRRHLDDLTCVAVSEPWLARLLLEGPATRELHREAANGFMLLAHTEEKGLYRPPHDHGRAWVVYGVQSGELDVGTYVQVQDPRGASPRAEGNHSSASRRSTRIPPWRYSRYALPNRIGPPLPIHRTRPPAGGASRAHGHPLR